MKKLFAMLLVFSMIFALAACGGNTGSSSPAAESPSAEAEQEPAPAEETAEAAAEPAEAAEPEAEAAEPANEEMPAEAAGEAAVMSYAEYAAAELDSAVSVETYVQDKQSWWDNKATVYTQDENGAYFAYNMSCTQEDYEKLVPGQKIRISGFKSEWSGEVEIIDGTFELLDGSFVAEPVDVTALLGTDELLAHQNQLVSFKGLTIVAKDDGKSPFYYGWDNSGEAGTDADLYFDASVNDNVYTFVVEYYLRNETTDAYQAVQNLKVGDTVDLEGFLYWYEGPQPHITAVAVK